MFSFVHKNKSSSAIENHLNDKDVSYVCYTLFQLLLSNLQLEIK